MIHQFLAAPLLAVALLAGTPLAANAQATDSSTSTPSAPIKSRAALDAYLSAHAGMQTPLDLLPPRARQRFLDSLVFGSDGVGGFSTAELATELTPGEIEQVLALFDATQYARMIPSRHAAHPPSWRGKPIEPGIGETGYDVLLALATGNEPDNDALELRYQSLFGDLPASPERLQALPERELIYLLRATTLVAFSSHSPDIADHVHAVVSAMETRGIAQPRDIRDAYNGLLKARRFAEAERYADQHPDADLPAMPAFVDKGTTNPPVLSVWAPDDDGATLVRTALDPGPLQILVTAGCHFSEDAAADISKDPVLGPIFARHARWLLLPPGMEDQQAVRDWNRNFPAAQAVQLYDRSEWTFLPKGWDMPAFFVIRNGEIVEQVSGWAGADTESRTDLLAALRRAGIADQDED